MAKLEIWFLDVGHGDCAYIQMPNGARMMIDCGGGEKSWPSKLLKHCGLKKGATPVPIPDNFTGHALDMLVITHPHGDHLDDIQAVYENVGFYSLLGGYTYCIDKITMEQIDFRKRGQDAAKFFVKVVKEYISPLDSSKNRPINDPACIVRMARFLDYEEGMDLNDLSWLVSLSIGGQKVLFTGDLTTTGVNKILESKRADEFKEFVKGTTILKVPHHGRENGCSDEIFEAFEKPPLLCIVSDEVLNDKNEGTSNVQWYTDRSNGFPVDGKQEKRYSLTTRTDRDIYLGIDDTGQMAVMTNALKDIREKVLQ